MPDDEGEPRNRLELAAEIAAEVPPADVPAAEVAAPEAAGVGRTEVAGAGGSPGVAAITGVALGRGVGRVGALVAVAAPVIAEELVGDGAADDDAGDGAEEDAGHQAAEADAHAGAGHAAETPLQGARLA